MSTGKEMREDSLERTPPTLEQEASDVFVQRLYGEWTLQDQTAFEMRLENDADFADAWRRVDESWRALDMHAEAPEVMTYRAEAIGEVRRANALRWFKPKRVNGLNSKWKIAAALAGFALLGTAWQLSPYGASFFGFGPGEYRTGIGEQRMVELDDHSRITMDAATRLAVRFSKESRTVRLLEGQAQFSVAKDPARPFKVIAGDRTVVAVGTVFTVEYVDRKIHVAMLEGKVAVIPAVISAHQAQTRSSSDAKRSNPGVTFPNGSPPKSEAGSDDPARITAGIIELDAGEELHIAHDGHSVVTPKADLEAATAWREGKVIFRTEALAEAVERMNRYSRLQLQIDDAGLAARHVSGVFEAGDTRGFVNALERYLPVTADYSDTDIVRLKAR